MANFEVLCWNISSSTNLEIGRSDPIQLLCKIALRNEMKFWKFLKTNAALTSSEKCQPVGGPKNHLEFQGTL